MVLTEDIPTQTPPKRIWGFWPTIGFSAVILTAYNVTQLFVTLVVMVIQLYTNQTGLQEAWEGLTSGLVFSLAIITSTVIGLLLVAVFIRIQGSVSLADYLGWKPIRPRIILRLVLISVVMLAAVLIIGGIIGDDGDASFTTELYGNSGNVPLFWLAVIFFAPLFEEVFFRGFLFVGLRASRAGPVTAIIITSLLWAIMHLQYNLFGIAQILSIGIIMGIVRHKTDSLWSPLIIHILWNAAAVISMALYVSPGG